MNFGESLYYFEDRENAEALSRTHYDGPLSKREWHWVGAACVVIADVFAAGLIIFGGWAAATVLSRIW